MAPLVCLVTPGNVSTTPRLVKNADALAEAGYRVHVIAGASIPSAAQLDGDILSSSRWAYSKVDFRSGIGGFWRRAAQKAARQVVSYSSSPALSLSARAHFAGTVRLAEAAARLNADLYIGHCLAGLPVVASAAKRGGKPYAFDIEDFHDAETETAMTDPVEVRIRQVIQRRLAPSARFLTVASPLIGQEFKRAYGAEPIVILNVFPLSQAPQTTSYRPPRSSGRTVTLYWFSQTIGPGRGIEEIIDVLASMRTPAELLLRGTVADDYAESLRQRCVALGLVQPLRFLAPGPPSEMARLAAEADLGLSIELPFPPNRDICLTNKIFVYLLAGIPQVLSRTRAQEAIAPEMGDAAILVDLFEPKVIAEKLDSFFADEELVGRARTRAAGLSRERFSWDFEKARFLECVAKAVPIR